MQTTPVTIEHLPAVSPDMVLCGDGRRWRVERCVPWLAERLGVSVDSVCGRDVGHLFADSQPSLLELLRETVERDALLNDILLRLPDGSTHVRLDLEPLGLSEDYSAYRIAAYMRQVPRPGAVETTYGLVGSSSALREVLRKIGKYGPTDAAVVITGETGTGKELVAAALHQASPRSSGPFVAVNCSAISEELLESELFGHEKGAFTGAVRTHRGRFERADGGTLFLDEIGDMPLHTQTRLLRVLETGRIERVGAEREQQVDVRIVAATNVPLERAVGNGRFRADLYHRISVLRIHLPPLRERKEDIPALVDFFLDRFNRKYGKVVKRLTPEAMALLESYLWPGNIRELRNVLERVYIETESEVIGARAFAEWVRERQDFAPGEWGTAPSSQTPIAPPFPLVSERKLLDAGTTPLLAPRAVEQVPRPSTRPANLDEESIRAAFRAAGGNIAAAARILGVHRATLYRHLQKLGLDRESLQG
ncbi:sigma-54 specific flagellar transcriptional regulator A [Geothermobacter ehrlichii]|uniref:Sigma-54 specific flagellar transcriptional regulator A n=1 Tax=Geothermobacter ehrlichii TaxID=213224 RepID=A0A5D3WIS8_9BACT|nr:sigma 54-interacting transcriptional regulator [Geothermobacter ehrlichii]TYO98138.1 sigma-54 specific flagellar transcriptional regulator A [Geothermobacter ehrlichii]